MLVYIVIFATFLIKTEAARILAVAPTPSVTNQIAFYPIVQELAKRGHQVVFITTNPMYPDEEPPENLKEINLLDLSYSIWKKKFTQSKFGDENFVKQGSKALIEVIPEVFEEQMKSDAVQNLINSEESFDLLLLEAGFPPAMIWSYIYKVPVIKVSSMGLIADNTENFRAPVHPFLYPGASHKRIYNLTLWETFQELYKRCIDRVAEEDEVVENEMLERIYGREVPPLSELQKNAHVLFLNVNNFWERNRPLPRNVVYVGQVHQKPVKDLPEDIKSFMDASEGVIYMSFGNPPSQLPPATLQAFLKVFSEMPYRVLWQSELDELPGIPDNVMIRKSLPKFDIFRHSKLKAIITQGDLPTIQEAIEVEVPLIGLPMLADQWQNVEHCVEYGVGVQLDVEGVDEEQFRSAVMEVIEDPSYRTNIHRLRTLINDAPFSPLERAILWTEYVLKHGGASHLTAPAANMNWREYYEWDLVLIIFSSFVTFLIIICYILKWFVKKIEEIIAFQARNQQ